MNSEKTNYLLLTYDSCRYDVLMAANTPVLDSYCDIHRAEAPANFTYASHQSFFVGILPNVREYIPYYNRFRKQLIALMGVGEGQVTKTAFKKVESRWNLIHGLRSEGYQTVGAEEGIIRTLPILCFILLLLWPAAFIWKKISIQYQASL